MKLKSIKIFLLLFITEGAGALTYYFAIPSEAGSARFLHQSLPRLALAAVLAIITLLGAALLIRFIRRADKGKIAADAIECALIEKGHLHLVQTTSFWACIFAIELFFLTFIALPPFVQPISLWIALTCLQCWLFLRFIYADRYIPLHRMIRNHWKAHSATQRWVFWVLAAIGLLYFCAFIPLNAKGWNNPSAPFSSGIDEDIQYPIAVRAITPGNTFSSTVYHVLVDEDNVYGHPYVTLSSWALIPSRLIYGSNFGDHEQLNLLLLRQFMNVLPLLISAFLLVYIVTRFNSLLPSAGLFILMLTIPGVVKYNIRFYHPDALVVLLVTLTLFFLQRDRLHFKQDFYLAAATCAIAAAVKLWGLFFFLAVLVYLLMGLFRKILTFKKMILASLGFLLVMVLAVVISNPGLLVPSALHTFINGVLTQVNKGSAGLSDAANSDIYAKGFFAWLPYFKAYFLWGYFFFFCFASLVICSIYGEEKLVARIFLSWNLVSAFYLIYFMAVKSYWYMLPLMITLYPAAFLLPALASEKRGELSSGILAKLVTKKFLWGIVAFFCCSQFVINLITIATSSVILNYAR